MRKVVARNQSMFQVSILVCGILIGVCFSSALFLLSSSSTAVSPLSRRLEGSIESSAKGADNVLSLQSRIRHSSHRSAFDPGKEQQQPGWKVIHVFYGDQVHLSDTTTLPISYLQANQWFSQYRQDELVSRLLHGKRNGYFIDLAANDPVRISNTYALETNFEWDGLCIEPNSVYWPGLSYRKCQVVAAIVGNTTMNEVFFRFPKDKATKGGILGGSFDNKKDRWHEGQRRFTVSLQDVFETFGVPTVIDYISLDVEGAEDLVMASFPFLKFQFHLMSVERPSLSLTNILTSHGYRLVKAIKNVDTLWAHQSIIDKLDRSVLQTMDVANYKYRENTGRPRIAPEEEE